MRLGIDASNVYAGGALTHLIELLRVARPQEYGFEEVVIWSRSVTLKQIEDRPWLKKVHDPLLEGFLPRRLYWQWRKLHHLLEREKCDILFVPGGLYCGPFRPFITMCRNMLPFELKEARRFGASRTTLRYLMLRLAQAGSFNKAQGLIFLTDYADKTLGRFFHKEKDLKKIIIPHGVDKRFFLEPRRQPEAADYSQERPFRLLYVSIINFYKHQWHVAEAVARLRKKGFHIVIDFVGNAYPRALGRFRNTLNRLDPEGSCLHYVGQVPFDKIQNYYHRADAFVFASSCENMSNILLEAMAAGLPIASSNRGPMPEILKDAALYFDPEDPDSISAKIESLFLSAKLRSDLARIAFDRGRAFTWEACAGQNFDFFSRVTALFRDTNDNCRNKK